MSEASDETIPRHPANAANRLARLGATNPLVAGAA